MLAKQIGRPTPDGNLDNDEFVARMKEIERSAEMHGGEWKRRRGVGYEDRKIVGMWDELNEAIEGYACLRSSWKFRDDGCCFKLVDQMR
jgi:nitric oxide reductase activation protein